MVCAFFILIVSLNEFASFLGAVHKICPLSGRRGFASADKGGGVLQMRASTLFCAKNIGLFEIYGAPARAKGVEPVRTFCGQGWR